MHHGILNITAIRPDAVRILIGSSMDNVGSQTWFIAARRNGKWVIDERSIQTLKSVSHRQTYPGGFHLAVFASSRSRAPAVLFCNGSRRSSCSR